jgi:integrase
MSRSSEDVDRQRGWIQVVSHLGAETKTTQSRKIPIHPVLLNPLRMYRRRTGPYFFSAEPSPKYREGGHQVSPKHLNEAFRLLAEKLGMPVGRERGYTLHALRRFFETFTVNAGTPQRAVDTRMGHRGDKSMGSVYYSLSEAESLAMTAKVPFSRRTATFASWPAIGISIAIGGIKCSSMKAPMARRRQSSNSIER